MGQRPDDWNAVSLCKSCHAEQHTVGERSFWKGRDVGAIIELFIQGSPKRFEIEKVRKEREGG